jgi:predicted methyltransferase
MRFSKLAAIAVILCGVAAPSFAATTDTALSAAVANTTVRSPANAARDQYRHPLASLTFWGVRPKDTILEIYPGSGYWTEILAPYAKATGGKYIAVLEGNTIRPLPARLTNVAVYGDIATTTFNSKMDPVVAPGTVDFVVLSRNLHDWVGRPGFAERALADFYKALKPGGILAVEQHRADPRPMVKDATDGYMSTAAVVKLATDAGFKLAAQSEINANPKDTKDHPFGVWTLPPTRQSAPRGQPDNPKFDHTKYDAIGESDRMTLRFVKPG